MKIGLRIDVDTFRGTRDGAPNLCRFLVEQSITASFFFSVGPDNMGRHIRRLVRPSFLLKMLRSKANSLYGWDILLRGTFLPGPIIGKTLEAVIRSASDAGHEIGLHAWDHYAWQAHIDQMNSDAIHHALHRGVKMLTRILGYPPICSASPSWKCNALVLIEKEKFAFHYNSDCRGNTLFRPIIKGTTKLYSPQIPVTLPTYDEIIGRNGLSDDNYNDYMLSLLRPEGLNVLTIHAEVEGIARLEMFKQFVKTAQSRGISFVPLGSLLSNSTEIGIANIIPKGIPGRDGWVAYQKEIEKE